MSQFLQCVHTLHLHISHFRILNFNWYAFTPYIFTCYTFTCVSFLSCLHILHLHIHLTLHMLTLHILHLHVLHLLSSSQSLFCLFSSFFTFACYYSFRVMRAVATSDNETVKTCDPNELRSFKTSGKIVILTSLACGCDGALPFCKQVVCSWWCRPASMKQAVWNDKMATQWARAPGLCGAVSVEPMKSGQHPPFVKHNQIVSNMWPHL